MQERHKDNLSVKRRLGRAVADLIGNDVHTIALDSGTTTEEVALCLLDHRDLTVVTNGLNVASALARTQDIEILVTGGILRTRSLSFFGKHAEEGLRHMHFDKLVLGADGIDIGVGVTTHFAQEASLNRRMCNMASEIILVSDSSKFGKRCSHIIWQVRPDRHAGNGRGNSPRHRPATGPRGRQPARRRRSRLRAARRRGSGHNDRRQGVGPYYGRTTSMNRNPDFGFRSQGLWARLARGEVSSEQAVERCIARYEDRENDLRAFAAFDAERALGEARARDRERELRGARSALHGLPFAVKDVIDTVDLPTQRGSPRYEGRRAEQGRRLRAPAAPGRLRAAGQGGHG